MVKPYTAARSLPALFVSAVLLSGCGGSPPPSSATVPGTSPDRHYEAMQSWMAPQASSRDLLYASDDATDDVYAYSYPEGKLVGKLIGFDMPKGECVDGRGDVFITEYDASAVVEYAHGGKTALAKLHTAIYAPQSCAIDPTTGNLAVAAYDSTSGTGAALIFDHARGYPEAFVDPSLYHDDACGFDDEGNLFVDGASPGGAFQLAELVKNGDRFTNLSFGKDVALPAGLQWEGSYLAMGAAAAHGRSAILHVLIGKKGGSIIQTTRVAAAASSFFIDGGTLIVGNADKSAIQFFKYPRGGQPTKSIADPEPYGVVVSPAR